MKKGICWGTLPPELSVADRLSLAADAGFDGVEPQVAMPESDAFVRYDSSEAELKEFLRMARDVGLDLCSVMGGPMSSRVHPIVDDDPAVRAKGKDSIRRLLEITAILEAEALLLVPHWVNDRVRYDVCYERTLEALQELGPEAEAMGVVIAVENVWNKFLLSPIEFARIIDEADSPAVQAYFDVGNYMPWAYPHHWIEILGDRIARVHVKDYRLDVGSGRGFVQLLHGDVPWPEVRKALKDIGYDGWITAEVGRLKHFPKESIYDTAVAIDRIVALA